MPKSFPRKRYARPIYSFYLSVKCRYVRVHHHICIPEIGQTMPMFARKARRPPLRLPYDRCERRLFSGSPSTGGRILQSQSALSVRHQDAWVYGLTSNWMVVWNMNFIFPYIGNVIIPTDEVIFFRGVGQPPTS